MIVIVAGVSGSGKTTIGEVLAARLAGRELGVDPVADRAQPGQPVLVYQRYPSRHLRDVGRRVQ